MADETILEGGCLCGAMRYYASRALQFTALCHCRMCQRWSGSAMLGTCAFERNCVTFTGIKPSLYRSSSVCERGFCSTCGSSLFTRYDSGGAFDDVIFIMLGTLDDPERAPPDIHYGTESELAWIHLEDGLPRVDIDVDDPGEQNALFDRMVAATSGIER